ncbi:hypothetical protein QQS21_011636 [Conoideocrella luteorostrata]|uniref:Alpha-1,3-mannosyltransferase CMT1 n=1 Tax=Conoideocrella luteorostrata TaxID=1105319 RepID=A0AAJ0CHB6_9HYPO|nr:hypothetical protein QQS21_011636 [Conoideocrella luteorostrata]
MLRVVLKMRKKPIVPLLAIFFVVATLYLRREFSGRPHLGTGSRSESQQKPTTWTSATDGAILPAANITEYLQAILVTKPSALPNLNCPAINHVRYDWIKGSSISGPRIRYFFALNLRESLPVLPRLIGSLVEAIRFLGPRHCVLSIAEGNSPDGTADVLAALKPTFDKLGLSYYFQSSTIDPGAGDRVKRLAELRNMALAPLLEVPGKATQETTIIFLNDVAACADDILELIHQKKAINADMTCAMDWTYVGRDPTFYDVWVARTIGGDTFFNIPADGNWNSAWNLFWNAEDTQRRFFAQQPFQVFSCWNGATAFTAAPILNKVRFRAPNEARHECGQGEPQLFCKDLWFHGYRKIAVVPSINLEYSIEKGRKIKEAKGFTSNIVSSQGPSDGGIDWQLEPPEKVKCMSTWDNQYWVPWNETLK